MRAITAATLIGFTLITPALAQAPGWQQAVQGLLSGDQRQDQAVREAYERGYRQGRQDEARLQRTSPRDSGRYNSDRNYPDEGQLDRPYYNR